MMRPRTSRKLTISLLACSLIGSTRGAFASQPQPIPASTDAKVGIDLFRSGNTEGAIKALRDATGKDKADADAWYYLGLALIKHHEPQEARKAFETTIRLRPTFVAARNGIAYALIMTGKPKDARRAAEASLKLEPANAETHYLLGVIHLRANAYDKSLAEAETSLKLAGDYAPALYLKIESLLGLSGEVLSASVGKKPYAHDAILEKNRARIDEAKATLEKYAKLNPRGEDADSVKDLRDQIDVMRVYSGLGGKMPAAGGETYAANDLTTKAAVTARPEPLYTERARMNNVTGTVRLRMVLAADGTVKYIFALTRLPDGLTEEAIRAARSVKFVPATKDGHPVSQFVTIDYNFDIF
ncbi:MAG: TonB family protein [Pyrinomonadaceae bacterium]